METICSTCGVKFIDGVPHFSFQNKPTTQEVLAAKVCQYARKPGCLNKLYGEEKLPNPDFDNVLTYDNLKQT